MAKKLTRPSVTKRRPCTFYLMRHGESEGNVNRILQGQSNSKLTDNGMMQAQARAVELKSVKFDLAFSSDLIRAHKTAEIIATEHKLAVTTSELLREMTFGRFDGQKVDNFYQELRQLLDEHYRLAPEVRFKHKVQPDIESDAEMIGRLLTFFRQTALAYPGKTALVVSHGAIIRTLLIHLGWGTYEELAHGAIKNTGYIILKSDGVEFEVVDVVDIEKQEPGGDLER